MISQACALQVTPRGEKRHERRAVGRARSFRDHGYGCHSCLGISRYKMRISPFFGHTHAISTTASCFFVRRVSTTYCDLDRSAPYLRWQSCVLRLFGLPSPSTAHEKGSKRAPFMTEWLQHSEARYSVKPDNSWSSILKSILGVSFDGELNRSSKVYSNRQQVTIPTSFGMGAPRTQLDFRSRFFRAY